MLRLAARLCAAALALLPALGSAQTAGPSLPEGGRRTGAFSVDTTTPLDQVLAETDRHLARYSCKYPFEDYLLILDELADRSRYVVVPGRDLEATVAPDKIVVYLRHDEDGDPLTSLRMSEEEKKRGLSGSYYIRPTAWYYGRLEKHGVARYACMDELYAKIRDNGAEIGVHIDLLYMMVTMDIDPLAFQREELAYWRANGFPVTGGSCNGSGLLAKLKVNNTWMFSESGRAGEVVHQGRRHAYGMHSLKDFGFDYEAYRLNATKRIGDISGQKTGADFVARLREFQPGDRVSLLIHPMHWGDRQKTNSAASWPVW